MPKCSGLIFLLVFTACQVVEPASTTQKAAVSAKGTLGKAENSKNATKTTQGVSGNKTDDKNTGQLDQKWGSKLQWYTWSAGLALAKKTKRPLCVVVYTDWCPKCKKLGPLFQDSEVEKLAQQVVMVRQNQDERPEWLTRIAQFGSYVPRFLFFNAQGDVLSDIKGPVDRYPYFYTPGHSAAFQHSLKRAIEQK